MIRGVLELNLMPFGSEWNFTTSCSSHAVREEERGQGYSKTERIYGLGEACAIRGQTRIVLCVGQSEED